MGTRYSVDEFELALLFCKLKLICKETKLKEFFYKFLHIIHKKELYCFGIKSNKDYLYSNKSDSIGHTFIDCHPSKYFLHVPEWFNSEHATFYSLSTKEFFVFLKNSCVVYKIPCTCQNTVYVGETWRLFQTRKKEHMEKVRLGLKQRKVLEGIESLRQKHRGMRVLNNFDHVETWKPVLNSFFDREKDGSRQLIIAKVKVLHRPQTAIPAHFDIIYTSLNDHDTSCAVTKLNN